MLLLYDSRLRESLSKVLGDKVEDFINSLTQPGRRYYVRVNMLKISPEIVIDSIRSRGIDVYRDEELSEAIYFPVKGPNKLSIRDKIVVVDKYSAESVYMGSHLYGPGVINCSKDIKRGDYVSIVSENGVVVGEGISLTSCKEMVKKMKGLVVQVMVSVYSVPPIRNLPEYVNGFIYPQSLAAMYVSRILDPKPGEFVVDICAAPGGKTSHIVELSRGRAYVIAVDHSRKKLEKMRFEISRLGHEPFVEMWRTDARYMHIDFSWIKADKILIDPPCSALGVRPKLYDVKNYSDVVNAANYQIQFLKTALKLLKKEGILVYSTCTVTIEENEEVIEKILSEDPCIQPLPIDIKRSGKGYKNALHGDYFTRFYPHEHDTTGYFIAKLIKKC